MKVYVFGCQTDAIDVKLSEILRSDHEPILAAFLTQSGDALRSELSKTSKRYGQTRGTSYTVEALSRRHVDGRNIALDHALVTIYHLAVFFRYAASSCLICLSDCKIEAF